MANGSIKKPEEIEVMQEGGKILAQILRVLSAAVKPGISTLDLDSIAREKIKKAGALPAFEGYIAGGSTPPYPAVLCTSIDEEVVHGIPSAGRILKEGQIIGLDLGIVFKGLFTDAAVSVAVGKLDRDKQRLLEATKEALLAGIEKVKPGNTIGDVAFAVESVANREKLGVVRDLVGHGVGHGLHEKPDVPNFGRPGTLERLFPGMTFAIEPMFTLGGWRIKVRSDGWTIATQDRSPSAHFEHTVAVTNDGCLVLTALPGDNL